MGFKFNNGKSFTTSDGIPYIWQSGDETTPPSYVGMNTSPNATSNGLFGYSVAVGSGRIVVGAPDETNTYNSAGRAHVYNLDGTLIKSITHPTPAASDQFGNSVAVGSGRIVVGAYADDISGIQDVGSAHIYDLNGGYVGTITHPSASESDLFGSSVAVGSGRIVVGAWNDDTGRGSAHIYDLNGGYVGIIPHPSAAAGDEFGRSVAVGSGKIVVGAPLDNTSGLLGAGSAHIYDLNGGYVGIITHPSAAANDQFGYSVAVGSGRIVVGAYLDDIGIGLTNAGSAHIYDLNGNYVGILTHPSAAAEDYFGNSVAVGSGRIVVGVPRDHIGALSDAGSAHIYSTPNVYTLYDGIDLNYS